LLCLFRLLLKTLHDRASACLHLNSMAATYKRVKQEQQELANVESGASSGAALEVKKNKQRVLVLASRGITQRYRHLMEDVLTLLPHSVKESKFDQVIVFM
jgi:ribosome biogenesis protein BRX1